MSSSETEGAENTDEELSSSDLDSSTNDDQKDEEELPLQEDMHQQNLIAIHLTDQMKKKDGEVHGLRYMIVSEHEIDDDDDDIDSDEDKQKKFKKIQEISDRRKMVSFPLFNYTMNDTPMLLSYLASAMFIFALIIIIPIIQKVATILNLILFLIAVFFALLGIWLDGKFYLMFNYETKEVYVQQKMWVGNCIFGNKGVMGKYLGTFETFKSAVKVKLEDIIGESVYDRFQFMLIFEDHENGETYNVLFTTTNEEKIDELEYNVNKWWQEYDNKHQHIDREKELQHDDKYDEDNKIDSDDDENDKVCV